MNVEFSTDGQRALIFGGPDGQIYEYRHDLYTSAEIHPIFIDNINSSSPVYLNDVSWRPDCDQGLIIGGGESLSNRSGYVMFFSVSNGASCD